MKINILIDNPGDARSGYLNLDPFAPSTPTDSDQRIQGDITNLDSVADDGEAKEILALDILDYFPSAKADEVIRNWTRKLAHGGTLTISVVDVREVSRAIVNNAISMDDVNELLHGAQREGWQYKKASFTLAQLNEAFLEAGFKILARRVQDFRAVITVERP